jgi:hypothetical protein
MMQRNTRTTIWIVALVVSGVPLLGRQASAMRYVEFNISVDRKAILRASVGDGGNEDEGTVWRYLKRLPLRPLNGYRLRPDPGHPRQATLKGKIHIDSRVGDGVTVSRLRLVRMPADGKWRVAPQEVERTFKLRKATKASRP